MKRAHHELLFVEDIKKGYFQIRNDGQIWRIAVKGTGVRKTERFIKIQEREMKNKNLFGYIHISFHIGGISHHCFAHRAIWTYFNGEIPDNVEINHKNGIKIDNRLENLELITHSENIKHSFKYSGRVANRGEKCNFSKLTDNDIREIRLQCSKGEIRRSISKNFNIHQSQVSRIVNRKRWAHIE